MFAKLPKKMILNLIIIHELPDYSLAELPSLESIYVNNIQSRSYKEIQDSRIQDLENSLWVYSNSMCGCRSRGQQ